MSFRYYDSCIILLRTLIIMPCAEGNEICSTADLFDLRCESATYNTV